MHPDIATAILSPHVRRYFLMVDAYLAHVSPAERDTLLTREIAKQERLYEQFIEKIDRGLPTDPQVSAFDYHETLAGLGARMFRKSEAA